MKNNTYAILQSDLRYDSKVSDFAKILWCEIYAYNYANQYTISNFVLSENLNKSLSTIIRCLTELEKYGYLNIYYGRGNKRMLSTKIEIPTNQQTVVNIKPDKEEMQTKSPALQEFLDSIKTKGSESQQ
jgi:DNA-binding Lrp family transcriptional regulator